MAFFSTPYRMMQYDMFACVHDYDIAQNRFVLSVE